MAQLEDRALEIEAAVDATPGIDPWCSAPDWTFSVRTGFAPSADVLALQCDGTFAMLAAHPLETGGRMFAGFEPLWGFACPLVGRSIEIAAQVIANRLESEPNWQRLVLPGFPEDLELARRAVGPLSRLGPVGGMGGIVRQVAHLDGLDAWLGRRSRSFRRNLRNATRRADDAGLQFVDTSTDDDLFERLLAIEYTSWKGAEGDGITTENMREFYRALTARLQSRARCRCLVAQLDGSDVGFILGGVRQGRYRGLQLSYSSHASELSIGHLLQLQQMKRLCEEGIATYDLGMDMQYKQKWADRTEASVTLVVERA